MSVRRPFLPRLLLSWLLPTRHREFILGDLDEEFASVRVARDGAWRARRWYWRQAFASLFSEVRYEVTDAPIVIAGESRGGSFFDPLWQDLRYAMRSSNRRPVFTTIAILTLALGIGANTGIFSIANWLLLRPVPGVAKPHELAIVEFAEAPGQSAGISWHNLTDLNVMQRSFEGLAGYGRTTLQVRAENGQPESIAAEVVGGDYFGLLGLRMQRGRPIHVAETATGRPAHVVVISDDLWTRLFARDPLVVGKTLRANQVALTVIGVTPAGFQGVERNRGVEAWVPLSIYHELRHATDELAQLLLGRRGGAMRELVGRLGPDVNAKSARADLQRNMDALIAQYPEDNGIYTEHPAIVHAGIGVPILLRERTATTVRLMLMVVGMLLLISSANVGNMFLVRGLQVRSDAAVRRALGASSRRLASQQIAECALIALTGGLVGLVIARAFLLLIEGGRLAGMPVFTDIPIDGRVLAFTAAVSIASGFLFALAPTLVLRKADPLVDLQGAGSRLTKRGHWLRNGIAVGQIALSLTLLVGALLLTRTILNLQRVDLGFDPERMAGFMVNMEPQGYSGESMKAVRRKLLDAVRAHPDIERAALARSMPFGCSGFGDRGQDPAGRSSEPIEIDVLFVSDGYFETLGVEIVRGRAIEPRDWGGSASGPSPTVLSETAARKLFATAIQSDGP
jgi:putative ABC transport system permease protein